MKKRILITGFSGFVAAHFIEYLYNECLEYKIYGLDIHEPKFDFCAFKDRLEIYFQPVDMMQLQDVRGIVSRFQPDYVLHLAAFSSVAYSWIHPSDSFRNNCDIFLNLITTVRESCPVCRILSVGSSEEYGNVPRGDLPIRESQQLNPVSPYAVARVAQEMLSKVFVDAYGMNIVMTRSFNHIGPGQDERFVVPSYIRRILNIKKTGKMSGGGN